MQLVFSRYPNNTFIADGENNKAKRISATVLNSVAISNRGDTNLGLSDDAGFIINIVEAQDSVVARRKSFWRL